MTRCPITNTLRHSGKETAMHSPMKRWMLFAALGTLVLGGCADFMDEMTSQPKKFPNDSNSRVLNEMKRPTEVPPVVAAVAADDRDARIAALEMQRADLEAQLAAERAKVARLEAQPPKVVEKMVEVEKRVEVPVPFPVEKIVEKTKLVKVPVIELRADALFDSGKAELRPNAV